MTLFDDILNQRQGNFINIQKFPTKKPDISNKVMKPVNNVVSNAVQKNPFQIKNFNRVIQKEEGQKVISNDAFRNLSNIFSFLRFRF